MKPIFFVVMLAAITVFGCKKKPLIEEPVPVTEQVLINRSVKASDTKALELDIDGNGRPDIYFYVLRSVIGGAGQLNFGVSTLDAHGIKMSVYNDEVLNNAADVAALRSGDKLAAGLKEGQQWGTEFGLLALKSDDGVNVSWTRAWGGGEPLFLQLRLTNGTDFNYAWIRIVIDKATGVLTVVDSGLNKNIGQEVVAGM